MLTAVAALKAPKSSFLEAEGVTIRQRQDGRGLLELSWDGSHSAISKSTLTGEIGDPDRPIVETDAATGQVFPDA